MDSSNLRQGSTYHVEYVVSGTKREMHFIARFLGYGKYEELQFDLRPDRGTVTIPKNWVRKIDQVNGKTKLLSPKPVQ